MARKWHSAAPSEVLIIAIAPIKERYLSPQDLEKVPRAIKEGQ